MGSTLAELVVKVGADTGNLIQGMKASTLAGKTLKNEYEAMAARMNVTGTATDKLKLQADYLSKAITEQQQHVNGLKAAYDKAAAAEGTNEKALEKLRAKWVEADKSLAKMESGLEAVNKELKEQPTRWDKLSNSISSAGQKMMSIGKTATMAITLPIAGAAAACVKLASDVNESVNKVDVAFKQNAGEIKSWADTTLKSYGLAKGTAMDMAAKYGDMATSMGLSTAQAASMSKTLVGLAGDMASFKNVKIDIADTALTAVFTGETESLKQLGIVMTQANLNEFALSRGIKTKVEQMDQASQTMLRYQYVMEMTKNSQGDFIRTGGGAANQMRIFSESLKELGASLGEVLLPVVTPVITKINEWIQSIAKLDTGTKTIILCVAGFIGIVPPLLVALGAISIAIGAISAASLLLLGKIALVVIAIGALGYAGYKLAEWMDEMPGTIFAVSAAMTVLNLVMMANPIGAVITGIVALIAAGVALYKNWEKVSSFFEQAWADIGSFFSSLPERASEWGANIVQGLIDGLASLPGRAWDTAVGVGQEILNGLDSIFSFGSPSEVTTQYGEWVSLGMANGILNKQQDVVNAATSVGAAANQALQKEVMAGLQSAMNNLQSAAGKIWEATGNKGSLVDTVVLPFLGAAFDTAKTAASKAASESPFKFNTTGGGGGAKKAVDEVKEMVDKINEELSRVAEPLKNRSQVAQLTYEMNAAGLKRVGNAAAEYRQHVAALTQQMKLQEGVIAATQTAYDKMVQVKGADSKEATDLAVKLAQEKKTYIDLRESILDATKAYQEQAEAARKAITEERESLQGLKADLEAVKEKYQNDLANALTEYNQKVNDVYTNLKDQEQSLRDEFEKTLQSRADAIANFVGLFDAVQAKDGITGSGLLANLKAQLDQMKNWANNLNALAARGIDQGLLAQLRAMGPSAAAEIAALSSLSDAELAEYVKVWQEKSALAKTQAAAELESQRLETLTKLQQLRTEAATELEKYRKEWEAKNAEIRKNTQTELNEIAKKYNALVKDASVKGEQFILNFADAIEQNFGYLEAVMQQMIDRCTITASIKVNGASPAASSASSSNSSASLGSRSSGISSRGGGNVFNFNIQGATDNELWEKLEPKIRRALSLSGVG